MIPISSKSAAGSSSPAATGLIDPRALMAIRSLELRARVVVEGFWSGLHRSPYHGFSVEFAEYRQYTPGDDLRYLDWRVYGRSDRYFIKRFEDETNLRCHLVVDQSRSMAYGSAGITKAAYASTLAATLGYFLHLQGDAIGLVTFDDGMREFLPPRHRPGHLRQVMAALDRAPKGLGTDLGAPLERLAEMMLKRGLMVILSDFLAPLDRLKQGLSRLAASGHELAVFQVLDPFETGFQFDAPALFEDAETGRTLLIDPAVVRDVYVQRLEQHCAALKETCSQLGADYVRLGTDHPMELALFDFLKARMHRRGPTRRTSPRGGGRAA